MRKIISLGLIFLLVIPIVLSAKPTTTSNDKSEEFAIFSEMLKEQKDFKRILTTEVRQQTNDLKANYQEVIHGEAQTLYDEVIKFKSKLLIQLTAAIIAGVVLGFVIKEFLAMRLRHLRLALKQKEYEGYFKEYDAKKTEYEETIKNLETQINTLSEKLKQKKAEYEEKKSKKTSKEMEDFEKFLAFARQVGLVPDKLPDLPSEIEEKASNMPSSVTLPNSVNIPIKKKKVLLLWAGLSITVALLIYLIYTVIW